MPFKKTIKREITITHIMIMLLPDDNKNIYENTYYGYYVEHMGFYDILNDQFIPQKYIETRKSYDIKPFNGFVQKTVLVRKKER